MSVKLWTSTAATVFLALQACSPAEPDPELEPYTRSTEEVIDQFTESYNTRNLDDYADCLAQDFVFRVHDAEWWGPSPSYPDSEWYLATELLYTEDLFAAPESISLEMEILSMEPYQLDTSFVEVDCQFELKVYLDEVSGYRAAGETIFITEETSDGVWSINRWLDLSETKERSTWSMIKYIFYEE